MRNKLIFSKFLKVMIGITFLWMGTFSMAQNRPIEDGFDFRTLPVANRSSQKARSR